MSLKPFTTAHFEAYAGRIVLDTGDYWDIEDFQLEVADTVLWSVRQSMEHRLKGGNETWVILPQGNAKTTLMAAIGLYCSDYALLPWIPIGAASRDQAGILASQAYQMIRMSPGLLQRFRIYEGYKRVQPIRPDHPGPGDHGLQVYAADVGTNDGVIPFPLALCDEGHRHPNMDLYRLWKGKCRKRGANMVMISTSGEPNTDFEHLRDAIRDEAKHRVRKGAHLKATSANGKVSMHEWAVPKVELVSDMSVVKAANPLSTITEETLSEDFVSPSLDLGTWKRLTCNIPARHSFAAISEVMWDAAETRKRIPLGAHVHLGVDVGWVHDTFAIIPMWRTESEGQPFHVFGEAEILKPPGVDSMLHPDDVKVAFEVFTDQFVVETAICDLERMEDLGAWLEDEKKIKVVAWPQSPAVQAQEYEDFMRGLRNGMLPLAKRMGPTIRHTGHSGFRAHVMNAIARSKPGDKHVFDRPAQGRNAKTQDVRVIDCLKAAAQVNSWMFHPPDEDEWRDFTADDFGHVELLA